MCNYAEKYGCNKEGIARMKQLENELTAMTNERDDYKRNNAQLAQRQGDSFDAIPDEPVGFTVTTMVTHG